MDDMRAMINDDLVLAHRNSGSHARYPGTAGRYRPEPGRVLPGSRKTVNPYYQQFPAIVQAQMDKFAGSGWMAISPV